MVASHEDSLGPSLDRFKSRAAKACIRKLAVNIPLVTFPESSAEESQVLQADKLVQDPHLVQAVFHEHHFECAHVLEVSFRKFSEDTVSYVVDERLRNDETRTQTIF